MTVLRSYGGRREHASGKRGQWEFLCVLYPWVSRRLVIRGVSSCAASLAFMCHCVPAVVGVKKRLGNDVGDIGLYGPVLFDAPVVSSLVALRFLRLWE